MGTAADMGIAVDDAGLGGEPETGDNADAQLYLEDAEGTAPRPCDYEPP
ncbi:hypothetical protein [Micromonospora sp. NPDC049274]